METKHLSYLHWTSVQSEAHLENQDPAYSACMVALSLPPYSTWGPSTFQSIIYLNVVSQITAYAVPLYLIYFADMLVL